MKDLSLEDAKKIFADVGLKLVIEGEPIPEGYNAVEYTTNQMLEDMIPSLPINYAKVRNSCKESDLYQINGLVAYFVA